MKKNIMVLLTNTAAVMILFSHTLFAQDADSAASPVSVKSYANYDFVPGDKILFEDHFTDGQDGEFPPHWELLTGQAVLNKINGEEVFSLTDGNYVKVIPRIKTANYLTDPFTVEYDTYFEDGSYGLLVFSMQPEQRATRMRF
jgi:hypothetical protein